MYHLFFLIFLAAVCVQVNSRCLDTGGVNTAVKAWLKDKPSAETNYGPIADWEFCSGVSFHKLFRDAKYFNEDLSSWNTSNVTDMERMFEYAESFNQDISGWDTAAVTSMRGMFYDAESFNQNVSEWDIA
uniref:BspA family leucine-rich repeat surface protein n=1 Tax=Corethron hystrix TaxID=216773 RepID=A0A7S1BX08_9STRA|mmetsp:Transcript_5402/g.11126  ORF Transcript_5402/g.11126 Transcript_5402/m.11126 type:complete len:130 (+) Transcript_5402:217-606(+)|eukprot:CAMPEP_0113318950 /NCGR_PEP_ID=MMETSP0010_2-20120614/13333_1 /TAXON_ID=216773 ORGANISM="Corethron hystrix, Strain 308" /NCGR_SAMPLE_ID=MMETSP0010_2 /ASSEMBLY_ACC=CAM_ASM_000155 /LENGTH=129 /DNA_ID=CAMNT_0000176393 /DNA_START=116 /DNA_END=505 /DNA_ORIENTATION=+ /assembly_acc=CAM_ASM_000155